MTICKRNRSDAEDDDEVVSGAAAATFLIGDSKSEGCEKYDGC
jgi:hypothetical protein